MASTIAEKSANSRLFAFLVLYSAYRFNQNTPQTKIQKTQKQEKWSSAQHVRARLPKRGKLLVLMEVQPWSCVTLWRSTKTFALRECNLQEGGQGEHDHWAPQTASQDPNPLLARASGDSPVAASHQSEVWETAQHGNWIRYPLTGHNRLGHLFFH